MDNVWIVITHCSNTSLKGFDELKEELGKSYTVQVRKKWLPAYSAYNEIWLDIFINNPLADFLMGAVAGGFVWDVTKASGKILLSKLWDAIIMFSENNNNEPSYERLNFKFDDITIEINGISDANIALVSRLFQNIAKHLPRLKVKGVKGITKIIVPIEEYEDDGKTIYKESGYDYLDRDTAPEIWKIVSEYGLEHFVYKVKEEEIVVL